MTRTTRTRAAVLAALLTALLAAATLATPAVAHPDDDPDTYQPARRDHFVEHLFAAVLEVDDGTVAAAIDATTPDCFDDINLVDAQTDLDGDGDSDADDDTRLARAICYGHDEGIVNGQDTDTPPDGEGDEFQPANTTPRDQAASFVSRGVSWAQTGTAEDQPPSPTPYSDVGALNVHSGNIAYLSEDGDGDLDPPVLQGYPDGTFRPDVDVRNRHGRLIAERLVDNFDDVD